MTNLLRKIDLYYSITIKELYLLNVFATLTTKPGTKIVPTLAIYNFSDKQICKFFTNLYTGLPNRVRGMGKFFEN